MWMALITHIKKKEQTVHASRRKQFVARALYFNLQSIKVSDSLYY